MFSTCFEAAPKRFFLSASGLTRYKMSSYRFNMLRANPERKVLPTIQCSTKSNVHSNCVFVSDNSENVSSHQKLKQGTKIQNSESRIGALTFQFGNTVSWNTFNSFIHSVNRTKHKLFSSKQFPKLLSVPCFLFFSPKTEEFHLLFRISARPKQNIQFFSPANEALSEFSTISARTRQTPDLWTEIFQRTTI
mgnify:CR=1 FL=1